MVDAQCASRPLVEGAISSFRRGVRFGSVSDTKTLFDQAI